jgi:hypothetical protein
LAVIESSISRDVFQQEMLLTEAMVPGPVGPVKAAQQEILQARWNHYDQ